jgi:transcriptional regulator with XRE-family HTH domain
MDQSKHSDFGIMCRTFRMAKGLKQREVAAAGGVKLATYGNVESASHRVIGEARAALISQFLAPDPDQVMAMMEAWKRTPLSEYSEKRRATWTKRNALRSKSKGYDRIFQAMADLLAVTLTVARPDVPLCACGLDGKLEGDPTRSCEMCEALFALGLPAFTTGDAVMAQLAELQDKMDAARAKAEAAKAAA